MQLRIILDFVRFPLFLIHMTRFGTSVYIDAWFPAVIHAFIPTLRLHATSVRKTASKRVTYVVSDVKHEIYFENSDVSRPRHLVWHIRWWHLQPVSSRFTLLCSLFVDNASQGWVANCLKGLVNKTSISQEWAYHAFKIVGGQSALFWFCHHFWCVRRYGHTGHNMVSLIFLAAEYGMLKLCTSTTWASDRKVRILRCCGHAIDKYWLLPWTDTTLSLCFHSYLRQKFLAMRSTSRKTSAIALLAPLNMFWAICGYTCKR